MRAMHRATCYCYCSLLAPRYDKDVAGDSAARHTKQSAGMPGGDNGARGEPVIRVKPPRTARPITTTPLDRTGDAPIPAMHTPRMTPVGYSRRGATVETRKKVAEGSILNSPSGARETSNGRWYNRWPEEVGLE
ncbi:hypothetical protein HPB47_005849 [Ixodes persulcatus]|uniref:Uncharacterized protein n=1 Tax=Ixodes persulcatus TaxID=34615 RepID=A0AC60PCR4_IXOPE|nr:hypothetical protein HPB47_005849 [Ixodes persulcatus]